jgi:hypothetical protein
MRSPVWQTDLYNCDRELDYSEWNCGLLGICFWREGLEAAFSLEWTGASFNLRSLFAAFWGEADRDGEFFDFGEGGGGVSGAVVKDWGYLGSSGTRGLGFPVSELLVAIREDLRRESLHQVKLAVVAVPAEHAREVATELVNAGVQGILW